MEGKKISTEASIIKKKQLNEYWCYAAAISMFLEKYNRKYSQEDIVKMIHGKVIDKGATVDQIVGLLNTMLGKKFIYYPIRINKQCPSKEWLVREFENEGPFIMGFKPTLDDVHHMAILHTLFVNDAGEISKIVFYDPYHDENRVIRDETVYVYVFKGQN